MCNYMCRDRTVFVLITPQALCVVFEVKRAASTLLYLLNSGEITATATLSFHMPFLSRQEAERHENNMLPENPVSHVCLSLSLKSGGNGEKHMVCFI